VGSYSLIQWKIVISILARQITKFGFSIDCTLFEYKEVFKKGDTASLSSISLTNSGDDSSISFPFGSLIFAFSSSIFCSPNETIFVFGSIAMSMIFFAS
jgi:hypothetical protein